jgi:hypothetical protein
MSKDVNAHVDENQLELMALLEKGVGIEKEELLHLFIELGITLVVVLKDEHKWKVVRDSLLHQIESDERFKKVFEAVSEAYKRG